MNHIHPTHYAGRKSNPAGSRAHVHTNRRRKGTMKEATATAPPNQRQRPGGRSEN